MIRKILVFVLCLSLVFSAALANAAAPGTQLGFNLLSMLHNPGDNCVISPLSLAAAMSMAAEGAQGDTLQQFLDVLGVEGMDELAGIMPEDLNSANAVFTAQNLELRDEYLSALAGKYAAERFDIDADVVEKVNSWVQEHTGGLIEELITDVPAADTVMILLNAVAMDAEWLTPFSPDATTEESFHTAEGEVAVQMMHMTENFYYAETDGIQIVRLPYADSGLEMWIALPPEGGLPQLLGMLADEGMSCLTSDVAFMEVALSLPKLDVADDHSLSDALKLMGLEQAFSAEADFSGMSEAALCLDEILQKARIQIDENGTKAAAATAAIMKMLSAGPGSGPVEMQVDRPFAFVVSDSETGAVCFAGAIENPTKN